VTSLEFACDDALVAWFSAANGRAYMTRDGMKTWTEVSRGLLGARVKRLAASRLRTFVVWAETDRGIAITRDGGMSWHEPGVDDVTAESRPVFETRDPRAWIRVGEVELRIDDKGHLVRRTGDGKESPWMDGWRVPMATWLIMNAHGTFAGGPGGAYSLAGGKWSEVKLWPEQETGAADFLHAYWMGRYYGFYKD